MGIHRISGGYATVRPLHGPAIRRAGCHRGSGRSPFAGIGGQVRTIVGAASLTGALLLAACSEPGKSVDESLKKDLELAFTSSPITLQESPKTAQVVSAIERTAPQVRRITATQRAVRHTPAPVVAQAPVEVEAPAVVEEAPIDVAVNEQIGDIIPSSRPQPVTPAPVGRDDGIYERGNGDGIGSVIGVVLRGGHAGIDDCDPRVDRRRGRGAHVSINNRIPIVGTFPGSGRIASMPRGSGRVRF
jgi:hypothetical protein